MGYLNFTFVMENSCDVVVFFLNHHLIGAFSKSTETCK